MAGTQGRRSRRRLLLATTNANKVVELRAILGDLDVELTGLDGGGRGAGQPPAVAETGDTFLGNALLKARAYAGWSGIAALADDSGLEVDALGGAPGVRSARWAGPSATDADNLAKLLAELRDVPPERRTARFHCAAVLVDPSGQTWRAEAVWPGRIIDAPRGDNGFGYDPVFVPDGWSQTSAEVAPAVKDAVSHRGQALRALRPAIETWAQGMGSA